MATEIADPQLDAAKYLVPVIQDAMSETSDLIQFSLTDFKHIEEKIELVDRDIRLVFAAMDEAADE
ncbi:hypothetical protein N7454_005465 [Penicillium verhagenii]|nr:hypothetical protein N7454_005465 [Penicillium verhagenii]